MLYGLQEMNTVIHSYELLISQGVFLTIHILRNTTVHLRFNKLLDQRFPNFYVCDPEVAIGT
jgi:hypothetical protein